MSPAFRKEPPSDADYFRELFNRFFSYYLYLGMSYDEYWNGDCRLVRCYREAHELKREAKNQELHLQGLYIYEAFSVVMGQFAAGLAGKKPDASVKYPDTPHPITEREKQAEKARSIEDAQKYLKSIKARTKQKEIENGNG